MINFKKNNQTQPVVIFTHIPKTAGTTLKHIMLSQYKPYNVFEFYSLQREDGKGINKLAQVPKYRKNSIKLILGHIGFGLHQYLSSPYVYITMLRNPINRVISSYYYLRKTKIKLVQDMSLKEFVITSNTTQNNMTKYISGEKFKTQLAYLKNQQETQCECNSKTLELAKKNLEEEFQFFGLLERFDESLILLKKTLGWSVTQYLTRNVAKKVTQRQEFPQETLRLIEQSNEYDLELYQFAQKLFEQRVQQYEPFIAPEVEALQTSNQSGFSKLYFTMSASYTQVSHKAYQVLSNILT